VRIEFLRVVLCGCKTWPPHTNGIKDTQVCKFMLILLCAKLCGCVRVFENSVPGKLPGSKELRSDKMPKKNVQWGISRFLLFTKSYYADEMDVTGSIHTLLFRKTWSKMFISEPSCRYEHNIKMEPTKIMWGCGFQFIWLVTGAHSGFMWVRWWTLWFHNDIVFSDQMYDCNLYRNSPCGPVNCVRTLSFVLYV
jgi:hypothetical protein